MGIFDISIFKNLIINIKNFFHKEETTNKIAERKAEEDTIRYRAIKRMEYKDKIKSTDAPNNEKLDFPYQQIEEYRKQRFEYYINLLNKQSKQK
jgi:hypothetical protein